MSPARGQKPEASRKGRTPRGHDAGRIAELEAELFETRAYVQSMREEHEAADDKLQAAHEEVQSANEELQSVNEELETSKEELESANEELTTVNDEMSNRNVELNRLNGDLVNLQSSAKLAIVLVGRDLSIRRFSPQAEKLFNLLVTDVGRPIGDIRHGLVEAGRAASPAARESALELDGLIGQVIAEVREQEREVIDGNGSFWSVRVRPYMTLDNKVDGAVLVLVDIDAAKRSERAVAVARDYAESTVDSVRDPLLVLDKELCVERANRAFYRVFRVSPAETIGKRIYDLGNGQWNVPRLRGLLEAILPRSAKLEDFEVEHDFAVLGRRTMLLNAQRVQDLDSQRKSQRILVAIADVTERKRLEHELRQSSADLSDAAERRNEFLAMLGHELRNPLSALSHGLAFMGQVRDDRERSEALRAMMIRQTTRIGALLDQLLDIARVISGKVELSKRRFDLREVVRASVETLEPLMAAQHHELIVTLPPEPTFVMGDPVRLTQVVENLLTNAAKYTNDGGEIRLSLEASEDSVRIAVADDGTGIDAALLPHIFEVFTQAPRTLDRAKGGLGLGLPLVRRLVEMHGGRVSVSSAGLGRGSEFVVTLPRALELQPGERAEQRSDWPPAEPGTVQPRRILVVDDEKDTATLLAELLETLGHQTLAVGDGPSALAALRTFDPEVVLLDLGLPDMDGYVVARRLREQLGGKHVLLVAVTGYQSDVARLKQAGFDGHLLKPLSVQKLATLLAARDRREARAR